MTQAELLDQLPFFAALSESQIAKLTPLAREVRFQQDEVILETDSPSKHFYILLAGCVRIEVRTKTFNYCIQDVGPGEVFGWSSLLGQHDTLFQVRARDQSQALCLDGSRLRKVLSADPELEAELLRRTLAVAADRIRATETKLGQLFGLRMRGEREPVPAGRQDGCATPGCANANCGGSRV
jgi:CRP-like cAMP-binding protein